MQLDAHQVQKLLVEDAGIDLVDLQDHPLASGSRCQGMARCTARMHKVLPWVTMRV